MSCSRCHTLIVSCSRCHALIVSCSRCHALIVSCSRYTIDYKFSWSWVALKCKSFAYKIGTKILWPGQVSTVYVKRSQYKLTYSYKNFNFITHLERNTMKICKSPYSLANYFFIKICTKSKKEIKKWESLLHILNGPFLQGEIWPSWTLCNENKKMTLLFRIRVVIITVQLHL